MPRRHNVKEINLTIDDVIPFKNENHAGFIIQWSADIGFGEYTLYRSPDENKLEWFGDSECMDSNCDKEFLAELMKLFVEKITIV